VTPAPGTGRPDVPVSAGLAELTQELGRHARMLHLFKVHLASRLPADLDWAAVALLGHLARCGPRRQGELAELAMLDPSTVSRYVGQLVRAELVERRPDQVDGRAVQLAAPAAGHAIQEQVSAHRDGLLHQALGGWDEQDLHRLTELLRRFNDDMDNFRTATTTTSTTQIEYQER
jgi:DNA-binding MarR family transcriptional regulator